MPEHANQISRERELLRESEERSQQIIFASPVAMIVSRGPNECVELVNDKFTKLFGYTAVDVPDVNHWWPLAYPDAKYREEVRSAWQERIAKARKNCEEIDSMEATVRCKDGSTRRIEFHLSTLGDAFLISFVDTTDRQVAEEALRASEERFRLAAEAGRMYAYEWDLASNLLIRSAECINVLGLGAALHGPRPEITADIHPDDLDKMRLAIAALKPEDSTSRVSYRSKKMDGTEIWLEQSFRGYFDPCGKVTRVVGMVTDITARKYAESSLKTLSGRLIEAQEQERRRIARDLHDDINQRLAILNIEFQRLADDPPESPTLLRERIQQLGARASEISSEVSAITQELHSPKLELLGIVAAIRSFADEIKKHQNISVDFQHRDVPARLDRNISLCLFRIFQEGLRNAEKHSCAKEVIVELIGTTNEIYLKIRDQGKGFAMEAANQSSGLGLVSMRERVALLKGWISIESAPGAGTTIQVRLPLQT